jgi:hypothetical protein
MGERVQLSRAKGWRMPPNTVKVARPGPYGNPFTVAAYFDAGWSGSERVAAQHCVDAYRALLEGRKHWAHPLPMTYRVPDLAALRGKNLACWCKAGQPCHADVLLELANAAATPASPPDQQEAGNG